MDKPSVVLKRARERILNPRNWCRYVAAQNRENKCVPSDSEYAVKWCGKGSLWREGSHHLIAEHYLEKAAARIARQKDPQRTIITDVPYLNDFYGHAAVIEAYDLAIKMAEEDGR
jgi:hypothetical protein